MARDFESQQLTPDQVETAVKDLIKAQGIGQVLRYENKRGQDVDGFSHQVLALAYGKG